MVSSRTEAPSDSARTTGQALPDLTKHGISSAPRASSPDIAFAIDSAGTLVYANAATLRCLGADVSIDLAALDPLDIYDATSRERMQREVIPEAAGRGWWAGELTLNRGEGGSRRITQVTIAHLDHRGELEFLSTTARNARGVGDEIATLVRREALLRSLVESSPGTVAVIYDDGTISSVDDELELRPDTSIGPRGLAVVHPDDLVSMSSAIEQVRARKASAERVQIRCRGNPHEWRYFDVSLTNRSEDPAIRGIVLNALDVTSQVEAETRIRLGFEHAAIGISLRDLDGRYVEVNPALCRLLGRDSVELIGRRPEQFTHPDDLSAGPMATDRLLGSTAATYEGERRYLRPDGSVVWATISVSLVRDANGDPRYFFSQIQDITDRKRAEESLVQQALHDDLTGLPNRSLLLDRLEGALIRSRRAQTMVAVLFIDVDQFKLVNDGLGHAAGDQLLVEMARRLRDGVRVSDTVGRFGGDEFVVICEGLTGESDELVLARRVAQLVEPPFLVGGVHHYLTVSTGVALAEPDDTAQALLSHADAAMYRAKARGRARAEVFEPGLRIRASDRLDLKSALRRSVDAGDLTVVYQPIMSLVGGGLLGAEALIRWEHPTRGPIPPTDFVPIAEEAGLIGQIGQQVLAEALEEVRKWRRELPGGDKLWVAVNLSARQLQDNDVIDMLASAIGPDDCTPQALHIEITESVLIDEPETCASNLKAIRALGVPISLDDFGTGYSSLSFLRRYPIDTIKVDRSFVRGLGSDAHDSSIVAAVVGLGKAFGLHVLAEGIETTGQLKRLQAMGCDQGQGYLWSPGLPGPAFRAWATTVSTTTAMRSTSRWRCGRRHPRPM